jgi:hypothetical protein
MRAIRASLQGPAGDDGVTYVELARVAYGTRSPSRAHLSAVARSVDTLAARGEADTARSNGLDRRSTIVFRPVEVTEDLLGSLWVFLDGMNEDAVPLYRLARAFFEVDEASQRQQLVVVRAARQLARRGQALVIDQSPRHTNPYVVPIGPIERTVFEMLTRRATRFEDLAQSIYGTGRLRSDERERVSLAIMRLGAADYVEVVWRGQEVSIVSTRWFLPEMLRLNGGDES